MSESTQIAPTSKPDSVTLTDTQGRSIVVRGASAKEQFHLRKFLGGFNEQFFGMAMLAVAARTIDGAPIPFPRDERGVDVIFDLLGEDGFAAMTLHFASLGQLVVDEAEKMMDQAKN